MVKRRRRRKVQVNPVEQVLNDLLGEVSNTIVNGLRQALAPPDPLVNRVIESNHTAKNLPLIKDAEVIAIRTEKP